jgi:hypothetical protein
MEHHPITQVVTTDGGVPKGSRHIEFILSADFAGTINGTAVNGTGTTATPAVGIYVLDAPPGETLGGLAYTISAGGAILTTF